tara:strand:+ start:762 stop:1571 length:810 start_codon:yes stop_codon:yes gene_type:complete
MEEKLNNIQISYNEKVGYKQTVSCFKVKTLTQIIPILLLVDSILFFVQTLFRWGAPCFLWWNSVSTTITFFIGHITRLTGIPVCIYSILETKKGNSRGSKILFNYLLLLLIVTLMDLFLCILEVDYVCNSDSINEWNLCSHEWGKEEYECLLNNEECIVSLIYDNMEHDKRTCEDAGCNYIKKNIRVKPACCNSAEWNYYNPCKEDPTITPKVFDISWCKNFSDFYDIGIGIVTSLILFGCTYIVNSYNMVVDEKLKFTPNPMEECGEE